MNIRNIGLSFWCAPLVLVPISVAAGGILLQDDFNDNKLNPAKWVVYADASITPGASVTEIRQWIEMYNRGHLVTVDEFMPTAIDGITIRGRVTFVDSEFEDSFQVRTRTDGIPVPPFGEAQDGAAFRINSASGTSTSSGISVSCSGVISGQYKVLKLDINKGESFDFVAQDDGYNVSLRVTQVGGDGTTGAISTVCAGTSATNNIAFYNRELLGSLDNIVYLDDVIIEKGLVPSHKIKGTVNGLDQTRARCINVTTGQTVKIKAIKGNAWDCTDAGLVTVPGDEVMVTLGGRASKDPRHNHKQ